MTSRKERPTRRETQLEQALRESERDVRGWKDQTLLESNFAVRLSFNIRAMSVVHFFELLAADARERSANATASWAKGNVRAQSETIKRQAEELDREKAAHLAADRAYSELACRTVSDAMYERLANRFEVAQVDAAVNAARVADLERQLAERAAEIGALRDRLRACRPDGSKLAEQLAAVDVHASRLGGDVEQLAEMLGTLSQRVEQLETKRKRGVSQDVPRLLDAADRVRMSGLVERVEKLEAQAEQADRLNVSRHLSLSDRLDQFAESLEGASCRIDDLEQLEETRKAKKAKAKADRLESTVSVVPRVYAEQAPERAARASAVADARKDRLDAAWLLTAIGERRKRQDVGETIDDVVTLADCQWVEKESGAPLAGIRWVGVSVDRLDELAHGRSQ
jgi:hypothetical protein